MLQEYGSEEDAMPNRINQLIELDEIPWGLHLVNLLHSTCDCGILKNTLNFERY